MLVCVCKLFSALCISAVGVINLTPGFGLFSQVNCYEMSAHLRSAGSDMLDGSTAVLRACSRLRGDPSAILRNGATSYVEGAASILRASREGDHATWHLEASAKMIVAAGNSFNSAVEKIKDKYIVGGATGDWELINQINHEFESAKEAKDMVNEGLENFPFEVKEKHCCTDLILTRRYGDEDIEVVVSAPFLVTARPECDWDLTAGTSEDEAKSVLALQVTVTKGGSLSIFTCTASQTEVTVTTVYMRLTIGDEDKEEHVLSFEDESNTMLQQLVQRYLDLRGVTRMTTTFLQRLLSNKDVFVNIFWLEILKGFVKQRK